MGLRVRSETGYDISGFPRSVRVLLRALKKYRMILADYGSDWYISGTPHPKWDDDELHLLKKVKVRDRETVLTGELVSDRKVTIDFGKSRPAWTIG